MEDLLKQILAEQQKTNQRLDKIEASVSDLKEELVGVKTQLDENTKIVKAIRHNQEFTNAKLEALETTTAKTTALTKLDSKFEVLNKRLFEQEAEIQTLKLVK